jgi:hypothetical protein
MCVCLNRTRRCASVTGNGLESPAFQGGDEKPAPLGAISVLWCSNQKSSVAHLTTESCLRVPKEYAPLGKSTSVNLSQNCRTCSVEARKRAQALLTDGSKSWSENHTTSLPYRGAHGNGLSARKANASGERAATLWLAIVIGQVLSVKEEPPGLRQGSVSSGNIDRGRKKARSGAGND